MLEPGKALLPLNTRWAFTALQYHTLILNRVYLVCIGAQDLIGLVVRGPIASPGVATEAMQSPEFWVNEAQLQKYSGLALESDQLLSSARANLRIPLGAISSVAHTNASKWGMGSVPYSGRIWIRANDKRHEFILLGREDGPAVSARLVSVIREAQQAVPADRGDERRSG